MYKVPRKQDADLTITIDVPKPRAKQLYELLHERQGRVGGRMKSDKDYNRQAFKAAAQRQLRDNDD